MFFVASARASIEQRLGRLRRIGLRELVSLERDTLRRLAKSTLAAVLAWEAMDQLGSPRPVLGALGAILVVQVTVRASLARSIQLTVGVMVGLGTAVVLGQVLGLHWWSIGLAVLLSLVLGEILRLGPFSSQVAISALLALSLGSGYGMTRAFDTAIGAVIGVIVNAVIVPPSLVSEGARQMRGIAENLGSLLGDIGHGLIAGPPDKSTLARWLVRSRDIAGDLRRSVALIDQGEESLRYNPRPGAAQDGLARLREARLALEHSTVQTRGIARSLMDLDAHDLVRDNPAVRAPVSGGVHAIGELRVHAGGTVSAFGRLQESPGSVPDREHAESEHVAAIAAQRSASQRLRQVSILDADRDRLLSSILVDAVRLVAEVAPDGGPHAAALGPPPSP
jgi:hypothetical protein